MEHHPEAGAAGSCWFDVLEAGMLTTVQDYGRAGHASEGVSPSGALDKASYELANRLVGNPSGRACLETTLRGPSLRLNGPPGSGVTVAVTGAPAPVMVNGGPAAFDAAIRIRAGDILAIGTVTAGVRSYLAVRGGFALSPTLDSCSTDLLSGLGPPPLARGQSLRLRPPPGVPPVADFAAPPGIEADPVLAVVIGPRDDWFTPAALATLTSSVWTVTPTSNRVGLRLSGPVLTRRREGELPPEGVVTGSIQVPPNGQPLIFLNDHPTTGGYPVIAVLVETALGHAAQAAPGSTLRLVPTRPCPSPDPGA